MGRTNLFASYSWCLLLATSCRAGGEQRERDVLHANETRAVLLTEADPTLSGRGPSRTLEVVADHEGTLHVWAESPDFDPVLVLADARGNRLSCDEDSGGGTTAYLAVDVAPQEALRIMVAAAERGRSGEATVHVVSAPETAHSRERAAAVDTGLEDVDRLKAEGRHDSARARLEELWQDLADVPDAAFGARAAMSAARIGQSGYELGDALMAARAWERLRAYRERCMPPEHPDLQRILLNLAVLRASAGDLDGARELQERVLAAFSRTLPADHADLQKARINLAGTLKDLGEAERAAELEKSALESLLRSQHEDSLDLQTARLNLANSLLAKGDVHGARELQEQALATLDRTAREDEPVLQRARLGLATTLTILGDVRGSSVLEREVLDVRLRTLPEDHLDVQTARQNLGASLFRLGDLQGARELQERVLEVLARALPDGHAHLQLARRNLALTLGQLGDLRGAQELEEKWLQVASTTLPPDAPELQRARMELALHLRNTGDLRRARELQQRVVAGYERTLSEDDPELQKARGNLATTLRLQGDLAWARELQERALAALDRIQPRDHIDRLKARQNLAGTLYALRDLEGARTLTEEAVEGYERTLPADHPTLRGARANLAILVAELGDFARALELQREILDVCERSLPDTHPELQGARLNLAVTAQKLGDLLGARQLEETVLGIYSRTLPDDHVDLQTVRTNLGGTRFALGDYVGARELFEKVLSVDSERLAEDHPRLQTARSNLANALRALGDAAQALPLEEKVLEVRMRTLPEDHPDVQSARMHLGETLRELGDLDAARVLEEQALEIGSRSLPETHPELQVARLGFASIVFAQGDLATAGELQQRAVEAYSRTLPADHPHLGGARERLLWTRLAAGDVRGASALAEQLASGLREALTTALFSHSTREIEELVTARRGELSTLLSLSIEDDSAQGDLARIALETVESLRSVGLLARALEGVRNDPGLARLRARAAEAASRLAQAAFTDSSRDEITAARMQLDDLGRERLELLRADPRASSVLEGSKFEGLSRSLAADQALIGYWRYARLERDSWHASTESLLAWVLLPGGEPTRIELGPIARVEDAVRGFRESLGVEASARAAPGVGISGGNEQALREIGEQLRALVFDPLRAALGPSRRLVIAPDDVLHAVPFDALPDGDRLLGESYAISLRSGLWELLLEPPPSNAADLLVLGGLDYGSTQTEAAGTDSLSMIPWPLRSGVWQRGFPPLPSTRTEASEIAISWGSADRGTCTILSGSEATRARVVELAPRARFLHLATHGWFAPDSVRSTEDLRPLDPGSGMASAMTREELVRGLSPMLLCGLALSGANSACDPLGRVEGLITAEEVASLDLRDCELAVLSACDTAVGVRRAGQGVASLQKALHAAGARTVITSLWKVPDEATKDVMSAFYRGMWMEGKAKSVALWDAKMELRAARDEQGRPLHDVRAWAAWVLTGNPD